MLAKNFKCTKLLAAGCSFTACSNGLAQKPASWAGMLAHTLDVGVFNNLAIPGCGNSAVAQSLISFLQIKPSFNKDNTLVIFNITGVDRIDSICEPDHPDANASFVWAGDLGFSWITEGSFLNIGSPFYGARQKHQGYAPTCLSNVLHIMSLVHYLKVHAFNWYFMVMDQGVLTNSPSFFRSFLDLHNQHWIKPDGYETMLDFCQAKKLVKDDNFHPTLDGHAALHHAASNFIKGNLQHG